MSDFDRMSGFSLNAMLCRRWTTATLREPLAGFGLTHPDSASDLVQRGMRPAKLNRDVAMQVASIERALGVKSRLPSLPLAKAAWLTLVKGHWWRRLLAIPPVGISAALIAA
jgi:hypothetical protein